MPFVDVASKQREVSRDPLVCHDSVTLSRNGNPSNSQAIDLYGVPNHLEFEAFQGKYG